MDNVSVHGAGHAADVHALDGFVLSSIEDRAERVKSGIIIRLPQDDDWRALHELVRKVHERTVFSNVPFSDRKYALIEAQARNPQPHQCLLVAEIDGRVVGLAWFSAGEYLLGEGTVLTTTHLLGVDSEYCGPFRAAKVFVKLLRGVAAWSKTRAAHQILVHVTSGYALKQTDRLIRAGGGICIGGSYVVNS
ncbi:hypothetical protein [Rhizobium sp. P44RR-XXIV]|uniref:GNAT family N-acetyltransferase n=1 Tax=Rhizobium sp. P44RR-XXIV TaxID=1921145 RepID=UPI0010AB239F|nr:hypothetical protein [Rhizobium sp. P44RR-XXIV]TIX89175.1 hypothetical protein BSK43_021455 [Rhizobium sp. P44RR-XXIV]